MKNNFHSFLLRCPNMHELLGDVFSMSKLINNIEKCCLRLPDGYSMEDFKGDATEFFVNECLHLNDVSNIFGVHEYQMIGRTDDMGADGKGINQSLNECLIQIKYRRPNTYLSYNLDKLNNIFNVGDEMGIHSDDIGDGTNYKFFIFTTACGLDFRTEENFNGKRKRVKCFNFDNFDTTLKDNGPFWKVLRERTFDTLSDLQKQKEEFLMSV